MLSTVRRRATDWSNRGISGVHGVRTRLLVGMAALFVLTMTVVGPLASLAGVDREHGLVHIAQLAILAIALPLLMARLARDILQPAAELDEAHGRLRSLYDQARFDALIDPITGLGNHRAFQEELHRQVARAETTGQSVALVVVDLDDLKRVNDELGHAGGDVLLGSVGRMITTACRSGDRGFRIGGDEFAILLPHLDAPGAHAVAHRLLARALGNEPIRSGGPRFSFSAGVSSFPEPATSGRELFRQADAALYWAKSHGRTDVHVYDAERDDEAIASRSVAELADDVVGVAERRMLMPVYQPIYDLQTGATVGFEGLVRPAADAPFRDAGALFRAAETTNRTVDLDRVCMEVIAAGDIGDGHRFIAFNVSPRSLETKQFSVSTLKRLLKKHGLAPERVVLELTEREAIEDIEQLRRNLEACQAAGIRVAADDVGAGNAGLRLLSEIRFDIVKIDLSLVQGGVLRDSALTVLTGIEEIAARSGASVIAEGIETVEQLEVVRSLGIGWGQGFLLSPPSEIVSPEPIDLDLLLSNHQDVRLAFLDMAS